MCFTKQAILMRRLTVLSLPLQLVFSAEAYTKEEEKDISIIVVIFENFSNVFYLFFYE